MTEYLWQLLGRFADTTSVIGLGVSVWVALSLSRFRKEVVLRGALEGIEKRLSAIERNLGIAPTAADLSKLSAHLVDLAGKLGRCDAKVRVDRILVHMTVRNGLGHVDEILGELPGLRTAIGNFRRDKRWSIS